MTTCIVFNENSKPYAHNNKGLTFKNSEELQRRLSKHQKAWESYTQAIEAYDKILLLSPDNIEVHKNMGLALKRLGDLQSKEVL